MSQVNRQSIDKNNPPRKTPKTARVSSSEADRAEKVKKFMKLRDNLGDDLASIALNIRLPK